MRRVAVPRLLSNTAQAFTPLPSQQRSLRVPMLAVLTVPHLSPASPVTPVLSAQLVHPGPYRGWSAWHGRVPADRACLTVSRARHDRGGSGDTCSVTLHAPLRRRRASQSLQRCCHRHWVAGLAGGDCTCTATELLRSQTWGTPYATTARFCRWPLLVIAMADLPASLSCCSPSSESPGQGRIRDHGETQNLKHRTFRF
jgi:hypothetical protein